MTASPGERFADQGRADRSTRFSISIGSQTHDFLEAMSVEHGLTKTDMIRQALKVMQAVQTTKSRDIEIILDEVRGRGEEAVVVTRRRPRGKPAAPLVPPPGRIVELSVDDRRALSNLSLITTSLIIPKKPVVDGFLIGANRVAWNAMVDVLRRDWSQAYQIPPEVLEELIAGAFERAGYDDVILTPRSGDHGRDVIALKHGVGSIRIIGSVKRYAEHREVNYDDIRALLGVMQSEPETSKGMVLTTSKFPPELHREKRIVQYIPTRLELLDGKALLRWLTKLHETD